MSSENPYPSTPEPPEGAGWSSGPTGDTRPSHQPTGSSPAGEPPPYAQQPGYGSVLPSGAPNPYGPIAPQTQPNVSAIVLTALSAVLTMSCYCTIIGIAPLILGILGIVKQSSDPAGAARLTKIGWIVLAVLTVLAILAVVGGIAWTSQQDSYDTYDTY